MKTIGYVAANTPKAQKMLNQVIAQYDFTDIERDPQQNIDILLVLGGDGFMLHSIHKHMYRKIPIYGINCGEIGFLLNTHHIQGNLIDVINNAYSTVLTPLKVQAIDYNGSTYCSIAINEASIFRRNHQAAFIKVDVNNVTHIEKLIGDGVLIATSAGSSAYNFSAGGAILPINSGLIALTGINVFRPKHWRSAILPDDVTVNLEIMDLDRRPVMVTADYKEMYDIRKIQISSDFDNQVILLFNSQKHLNERIISEQFLC